MWNAFVGDYPYNESEIEGKKSVCLLHFLRSTSYRPVCWRRAVTECIHGVLIYRPGNISNGKDIRTARWT
jgi:hypothetical protein